MVALIVVGVVAFIAIDAYILYYVLVKRHRAASDYAEISVPGEAQVELPAGKVRLTYHEAHKSASDEHEIFFEVPSDVKVEVTGGSAGGALELDGPGFRGMGSSKSTAKNHSRSLIGKVNVTEPGLYTVTVTGEEKDPSLGARVLVGK